MENIEQGLMEVRAKAANLVIEIDRLLASTKAPTLVVAPVEGETSDLLAYRINYRPAAQLSALGESVAKRLIEAGLNDEEIGKRMGVSTNGIARFRRRIARRGN